MWIQFISLGVTGIPLKHAFYIYLCNASGGFDTHVQDLRMYVDKWCFILLLHSLIQLVS